MLNENGFDDQAEEVEPEKSLPQDKPCVWNLLPAGWRSQTLL